MRITYEPGDVVKLKDDQRVGNFRDCKVILLHPHAEGKDWKNWKVKVYPDEGFDEEDSVDTVDERWFIPNLENLRQ